MPCHLTDRRGRFPGTPPENDSLRRFNLAFQKSRIATFALAYVVAIAFQPSGFVATSVARLSLVFLVTVSVSLALYTLYARGVTHLAGVPLIVVWLGLDTLAVTWLVWLGGGLASPWWLFYLSNTAAAAFVAGRRAVAAVGAASLIAYVGILAAMGQIRGIDEGLAQAVGRLGFLFGASFFCLRGILQLQEKRAVIHALRQDDQRRLAELTRLTQELDARSRELGSLNDRIAAADRTKSQFLANMSHELRTPLNSIIGFTQVLADKAAPQLSEKHRRFLGNILQSGQHLLALINDLLDLSKIEAGRMDLFSEPFEIRPLAEGVLSVMRGVTVQKGIEIDLDIPAGLPAVVSDPGKFKQVLFNLLSNAVKFSPDGATVTVRARSVAVAETPLPAATAGALRIDVIDHGIGIARADQDLIFEEFRRVERGSSRNYSGTGLGLALVKRLLEMQGGAVRVDSEPGRGSVFSAFLPLTASHVAPAMREEPPVTARPAGGPARPKVLVVEDNPEAYHTLSTLLEAEGYETVNARHGVEALRLIERERPAIITLDLVLPGLDGWEVLKDLKSRAATRDIPVVIVTMAEARELGLMLGADDFFVKPVLQAEFVQRVRELAPPDGGTDGGTTTILLIDDDPRMHELLAAEIEPLGYRLVGAQDPRQGLEMAQREPPALVVLDLMLPGMSGFEVAMQLQAHPATAAVPVVVLTAKDLTADDRERLRGRIVALLDKSTSGERLIETIRGLVRRNERPAGTPVR